MVKSIHSKPLRLYSTTRLLYWSARPSGKGSGLNKDSTRGTIREFPTRHALFHPLHCFAEESAVGPQAKEIWNLNVVILLLSSMQTIVFHIPNSLLSLKIVIVSSLYYMQYVQLALKSLKFGLSLTVWPVGKYNEAI